MANQEVKNRSRWQSAAMGVAALLGFVALSGTSPAFAQSPTVYTNLGPIVGTQMPGTSPAINAFLGVPFAAPPVGNLRLAPPAAHASWTTPLQTTAFTPYCMQYSPTGVVGAEDCLYLNVWVPAAKSNKPRAVMIFISGGGFQAGSPNVPYATGQAMAEQTGAIVITPNYRCGILGFLPAAALDAQSPHHVSGNYGILDIIASVQWAKTNAAAFGGNPNDIMIFGDSAGGDAVEYLMVSPLAKGLFNYALAESAVGSPMLLNMTMAEQEESLGLDVLEYSGCYYSTNIPSCLRAMPAATLAGLEVDGPQFPNIDGYVIPYTQSEAFEYGYFNKVPVLEGTVLNEFTNLMVTTFPTLTNPPITAYEYYEELDTLFSSYGTEVAYYYPLTSYSIPLQALAAVLGDAYIVCQVDQRRGYLKSYVTTYAYEFSEPNPAEGPLGPWNLPAISGYNYGDYHSSESAYTFGLSAPNGTPLTGKDLSLSQKMISYWYNWATTGNPNGAGLPNWPNYASSQIMNLKDSPSSMSDSAFSSEHNCAFWSSIGY